jgi:hypothetical protein
VDADCDYRHGLWIYRGTIRPVPWACGAVGGWRPLSLPGRKCGNTAGLALIVLGTAMVTVAATRFLITAKNIDSEDLRHGAGSRIDVALPALLVLLGSSLSFICRPVVTTPSGRR